jgi:quinol monooxygenase YgiN
LQPTVGTTGYAYVITYVDLLVDGNPFKGAAEVLQYAAASEKANTGHLLSFSVLDQLDRPNRLIMLEVWDTTANYVAWEGDTTTTSFIAQLTPLLGSQLDARVNDLCGKTYLDGTGCVPP